MTIEANKLSTDLYIDGAWRASTSGRRIDVYDPSTEQVIASVADAVGLGGTVAARATAPEIEDEVHGITLQTSSGARSQSAWPLSLPAIASPARR